MSRDVLQSNLDQIELALQQVSEAMLHNQSQPMMSASADVQRLSVELAELMRRFPPSSNKLAKARLLSLAAMMSSTRGALIRQGVMAERALATLMPAVQATTYQSASTSRQPYGSYGSAGRQSGAFRAFVA